jgi:hypothetical protein
MEILTYIIDIIFNFLMKSNSIYLIIAPYLLPVIMLFFIASLERYKSKLLRDFEEHKIGIDTRKQLSIKMSNNRLMAYQNMIESMTRLKIIALFYNQNPCPEYRDNLFEKYGGKSQRFLDKGFAGVFYFSKNAKIQFETQVNPSYMEILHNLSENKPIAIENLKIFSTNTEKFRKYLLSEVFPDDPTSQT